MVNVAGWTHLRVVTSKHILKQLRCVNTRCCRFLVRERYLIHSLASHVSTTSKCGMLRFLGAQPSEATASGQSG